MAQKCFSIFFWFSFTFPVKVLGLLKYLVIDNKDNENLYQAIKCLDPFPEYPAFKDLRATQQKIKYSKGPYSLLEVITFKNISWHSVFCHANFQKTNSLTIGIVEKYVNETCGFLLLPVSDSEIFVGLHSYLHLLISTLWTGESHFFTSTFICML